MTFRRASFALAVAAALSFAVVSARAEEPARTAPASVPPSESSASPVAVPARLRVAPAPIESPTLVAQPSAPVATPTARVPLARRWWFWAGLGAAAVGVVVAGIALGPRTPYSGNAAPGVVGLP